MGVFPAASSKHVPEPWAKLMSDPVSFSCFIDFCFVLYKLQLYNVFYLPTKTLYQIVYLFVQCINCCSLSVLFHSYLDLFLLFLATFLTKKILGLLNYRLLPGRLQNRPERQKICLARRSPFAVRRRETSF